MAFLKALIGDGRRQVGLAAAAWPQEDQPALWIGSEGDGGSVGPEESFLVGRVVGLALQNQVVEGEVGQGPQIAVGLQPLQTAIVELLLGALARYQPGVVRLA
jgi:hypothetical protein